MQVTIFQDAVQKLKGFKNQLEKEGVTELDQQRILKAFLAEVTNNKINVSMLKAI